MAGMNLTGQGVYQKGQLKKKSNKPTPAQRKQWEVIRALGCQAKGDHGGALAIHHIETGAGGRKDHDRIICLCWKHHQSKEHGIHGDLGRKGWEVIHGTESELLEKATLLLEQGRH